MEINEHSPHANALLEYFAALLFCAAKIWRFTWKTPPHDLARRIMNHIGEFKPLNEGGD